MLWPTRWPIVIGIDGYITGVTRSLITPAVWSTNTRSPYDLSCQVMGRSREFWGRFQGNWGGGGKSGVSGVVYQLAGRYLDILTTHGYSGVARVNTSLDAPETPHGDVALRREENIKVEWPWLSNWIYSGVIYGDRRASWGTGVIDSRVPFWTC